MKYRYSRFVEDLADEVDLNRCSTSCPTCCCRAASTHPWDPTE